VKQFNDLEISSRSSTFVSSESRRLISYLAISVSVDVSYIISAIVDLGAWNDLQISFRDIKSGTNRKLLYDFLLVVYSNFCRTTHRSWQIWCKTVKWPWNIAKVIDSRITLKLSCGHVCKMFGRQWTKEAKIAIFNDHTLIIDGVTPFPRESPRISAWTFTVCVWGCPSRCVCGGEPWMAPEGRGGKHPPKTGGGGVKNHCSNNVFLSSNPPKGASLIGWIRVVWCIDRGNPSTRFYRAMHLSAYARS